MQVQIYKEAELMKALGAQKIEQLNIHVVSVVVLLPLEKGAFWH
jgi:hypothetical protein